MPDHFPGAPVSSRPLSRDDVSDDMLMALADNELNPAAAAALKALIAADDGLAARYEIFAGSARALQQAYAPGAVPDRLIAALLGGTEPESLPEPQVSPEPAANVVPLRRPERPRWQPMAFAASLALAAGLLAGLAGYQLGNRGSGPALDSPQALAAIPAGESRDLGGATWRALGSYDTEAGLCRLLSHEGATLAIRRIICEEPGGWALALEVSAGGGGGYIPASDTLTELTDHALDSLGAGPALNASEEARRLPL